jgi:polyferredoxin
MALLTAGESMKPKPLQYLTIWILPLILIGGLFYAPLGYAVVAMMATAMVLSFFAGRYWCWHLCPRGAFLDILVSRITLNRPLPRIFGHRWFRWGIVGVFMAMVTWRLVRAGGDPVKIGMVFVVACILTTVSSLILGIPMKHRGWCVICPMGTLQEQIHKAGRARKKA